MLRLLAKAGGSSTMVSNRSRARANARSVSNASAFAPLDVLETVELGVGRSTREGIMAQVQREHGPGPPGQVNGEGAMVGKAVEGAAARRRELAGQNAVGPLIEKRAGLLPVPGCGEVAHARFAHLDLRAGRSRARARPVSSSPSRRRTGASFRSRTPSGRNSSSKAVDDRLTQGLQARRKDLRHEPAIVPVDDERWESVGLAVDQAIGARVDALAARRAAVSAARATRPRLPRRSVRSSRRSRISDTGEWSACPMKRPRGSSTWTRPAGRSPAVTSLR